MNKEQIYVQKTLKHLENCLKPWVVMRGNSEKDNIKLRQMLRDELVAAAERLS